VHALVASTDALVTRSHIQPHPRRLDAEVPRSSASYALVPALSASLEFNKLTGGRKGRSRGRQAWSSCAYYT